MKLTFEVEIKPHSNRDQDRLDATNAALDVLLAQVDHIREILIKKSEFMASGEATYTGVDPAGDTPLLFVKVVWSSEDIRPPM